MNEKEFQALEFTLRDKMVELLQSITPPEGMSDVDFTNFIQAGMWCLYCQLRENLGARAGMMAMGEVLATAAEHAGPGSGVHVDMIATPKPGKVRH